jgi:hypothetical protein
MSIFEQASRQALRFASSVGDLTTEQLWDLPLVSKTGRSNLDSMARAFHSELKGLEEVSFVDTKPDPRKAELELQFEIVKHVIAVKLADRDAAKKAAEDAEKKQRLMAALSAKQDATLTTMSEEEIKAELAKLA